MRVIVDIVILVVLLFFMIFGVRRGLIRQVLQVLGIIAAFVGAFFLAHHLATVLQGRFDLGYQISLVISAVALFVGIIVLFHLLGLTLQKVAQITLLGPLDRIGGAVFGLLKGTLVVSLLLVILLSIPLPQSVKDELVSDPMVAVIYPTLPVIFNLLMRHTPAGPYFEENLDRVGRDETVIKARRSIEEIKSKVDRGA